MIRRSTAIPVAMLALVLTPTLGVEGSTSCVSIQTSGTGEQYFQTCVTDTGNVGRFIAHLGAEDEIYVEEGYMICDSASGDLLAARAWSRGTAESNLAVPTTKTATKNVRQTADGRFSLTQTFTRDAAEKELHVTMTLKNLGPGLLQNVWLQRFARLAGNDDDDLVPRTLVRGADAIIAMSDDGQRGIVVGVGTPEISHDTFVEDALAFVSFNYDDCLPLVPLATPTAPGNYVGFIRFNLGSMAQGASKTMKLHYRGF